MQKGSVLAGKYELVERLGEGGMGSVWVARNAAVGGAEVAVKLLHAHLAGDRTAVERFRNEAQIAARIGHPSIVRVFDFGEADDGAPFMVMERLQGESLAERLEREGPLPPREAASLVCAVLEALEAAHGLDVLHRDLKPENVFLAREGSATVPKILDFGVSKILGDDATRTKMTRTGSLVGTPAYMSPEQVMGTQVDLRSDVWAMGVILYELLTGRLPFDGNTYNAVLVRIATGEPDPVARHAPGLDPRLAAVVERAMARKPSARFPSAARMREALGAWLEGRAPDAAVAPRAQPTPARPTPMAFEHSDTLPDGAALPRPAASLRPVALGAGATLALAAAMIVANPFTRARPAAPPTTRAAPAPAPARHALRIESLPRGAHVTVDGQTVMLPAVVTADGDHRVRVSASGYGDWEHTVPRPSGDVTLVYAGAAVPAADAGAPPPAQPNANAAHGPARERQRTPRGQGPVQHLGTRTPF